MNKHLIRLNKTNSVNSVNVDNMVAVDIQQTTKPLIFTSLKEEVDQHEVFLQERENCNQYRLITTINPYCTNILFNPVTEIVKPFKNENEPWKWKIVTDNIEEEVSNAKGKKKVDRVDMLRNTEYSSEKIGYIYYPGTDIFNNHLLRNKSFKIVNPNLEEKDKDTFNTLEDFDRTFNGEKIQTCNRFQTNSINTSLKDKHLYEYDDIMDLTDSINTNLMEENGWWGFVNKTSIKSKEIINKVWHNTDFNLVLNNKETCDFIDLYPDRTLFSFNPKYNKFLNRVEYNWDYCLTYPYMNFYEYDLIQDDNGNGKVINALYIDEVSLTINAYGENILLFRTLCKHNLKVNDTINLYYKKANSTDEYDVIKNIIIKDIGDSSSENQNYYFTTSNLDLLIDLGLEETLNNIYSSTDVVKNRTAINNSLKEVKFRFKHFVNGYESEYYIRLFKKLESKMNNDLYPLAFSSTIYADKKTQITFTDGFNIDNILDNRGRPITEIYFSIIKNNEGNETWYESKEIEMDRAKYSHCFSEVSCGFDLYKSNERKFGDVKTIYCDNMPSWYENIKKYLNEKDIIKNSMADIKSESNIFVGDLVEFNIINCEEVVLEDCYFRFNTYLREHIGELNSKYSFNYDEFISDDYYENNFKVTKHKDEQLYQHKEGYYYKPHYKLILKENSSLIQQRSHYALTIKTSYLDSIEDKVLLFIRTTLPHNLHTNDTLLIFDVDNERDVILKTKILYVKDKTTFAIGDIISKDGKNKLTCRNIKDILDNKFSTIKFRLCRYNNEIPYYAERIPHENIYVWRNINNVGNKENTKLPEYSFNNGYFYINQEINFFLKRQDPLNKYNMYYDGSKGGYAPMDVYGNTLKKSDFEYKDETQATC